jgi:glycosyltransferase involved in cell wall biosynthesis
VRVLLISDIAHTGFGRVGRELGRGLMGRGHDIRIVGINWRGLNGELAAVMGEGTIAEQRARADELFAELDADPLTEFIMPATIAGDEMGHNLTSPAIRGKLWPGWFPEAVIIVADPRAMRGKLVSDDGAIGEASKAGMPILNYVPVEGTGLPDDWKGIYTFVAPVAMSAFGQGELQKLLGFPVPLAPHGVSPAFHPVSPAQPGSFRGKAVTSRDGAKMALGIEGKTVVLRTDRYIFRKNYPAFFRVLEPLLAADPNLLAVVHTTPYDDDHRGTLWQLISRLPGAMPLGISAMSETIWGHPQIMLTNSHDSFRGLNDADLNVLYNAADVYLSPTMAEGFGLCLAESLSVGTPVVTTDYSAIPEVVGPGGFCIPPTQLITNAYAHEWALVDEDTMRAALVRLLERPALRREMGAAGRRHIARFTWDAAVDVFDGLIQKAAAAA